MNIGHRPGVSGSRNATGESDIFRKPRTAYVGLNFISYICRLVSPSFIFHPTSPPHLPRVHTRRADVEKRADACERANLTLVGCPPSSHHSLLFATLSTPRKFSSSHPKRLSQISAIGLSLGFLCLLESYRTSGRFKKLAESRSTRFAPWIRSQAKFDDARLAFGSGGCRLARTSAPRSARRARGLEKEPGPAHPMRALLMSPSMISRIVITRKRLTWICLVVSLV